jgi:hypothetical protein
MPEQMPDYEPEHLWDGRDPREKIDYDVLLEHRTKYLIHCVRPSWDQETPFKTPWHLSRDTGLRAWCRHAAAIRFGAHPRPNYTLHQYDEVIFGERLRRKGRLAMRDPYWKALRDHMWDTENVEFFRHLHLLFKQKPVTGVWGRWAFCVGWDRESIPFEFWSYPAIAKYLETKIAIKDAAPSSGLLSKWATRMELVQAYPPVVTDFVPGEGIPEEGYHQEAFDLHGIPPLPARDACYRSENHNTP